MPKFKGVNVYVTDASGNPLPEFGTRSLERAGTISCYIQSETNVQFKVAAKPHLPFLPKTSKRVENAVAEPIIQRRSHPRGRQAPPAWHLLASVYLDGRTKPERRAIIYTDQNHPEFKGDGKVVLSHRWVQNGDGDILQHTWVFKDAGIETMLDKLLINGEIATEGAICKQEEDDLLKAMDMAGIDEKEESRLVGQITVILKKVTVSLPKENWNFRAMHKDEDTEDEDMDGDYNADGLSHTTGLGRAAHARFRGEPVHVIEFKEVSPEEDFYAVFKFHYRSEKVLRKFNFKDFPTTAEATPARRRIGDALSSMTPLSITYSSSSSSTKHAARSSNASSSSAAGTSNSKQTEGVGFSAAQWKDHNFDFKHDGMRADKHYSADDESDQDTQSSDDKLSAAEKAASSTAVKLGLPSFLALSKSPIRNSAIPSNYGTENIRKSTCNTDMNTMPQFTSFRSHTSPMQDEHDSTDASERPGLASSIHAPRRRTLRRKKIAKSEFTDPVNFDDSGGLVKNTSDRGPAGHLAQKTRKRRLDLDDDATAGPSSGSRSGSELPDAPLTTGAVDLGNVDLDNVEALVVSSSWAVGEQGRKRIRSGEMDEEL